MTNRPSSGYSGTPLATKLGLRPGMQVLLVRAPEAYASWLEPLTSELGFVRALGPEVDVVHLFTACTGELARTLAAARAELRDDAVLWVSWPKKASKVPTTVSEDVIREVALPLGFVDVKVCAVDATWSGLKLVLRKALREPVPRAVRKPADRRR